MQKWFDPIFAAEFYYQKYNLSSRLAYRQRFYVLYFDCLMSVVGARILARRRRRSRHRVVTTFTIVRLTFVGNVHIRSADLRQPLSTTPGWDTLRSAPGVHLTVHLLCDHESEGASFVNVLSFSSLLLFRFSRCN